MLAGMRRYVVPVGGSPAPDMLASGRSLSIRPAGASSTVGSCNTFLTRLGRKADLNFLRAMPVKKGSPALTQVSDARQHTRCCCHSTSKSYSP